MKIKTIGNIVGALGSLAIVATWYIPCGVTITAVTWALGGGAIVIWHLLGWFDS
jgi:hypothetical protein